MEVKKAKKLVVDTNAFIKAVRIENLGQKLFTIPQVIDEVRDKKAREFLQNFPFPIITKDPSPAALKTVAAFARKTGDYAFLSAADLRVLALVYTLEVEAKGSASHLRTEPLKPGALNGAANAEKDAEDEEEEGEEEQKGENEGKEEKEEKEAKEEQEAASGTQEETQKQQQQDTETSEAPKEGREGEGEGEGKDEGEGAWKENEQDDDDGWITPDNIGVVRAKRGVEDDLKAEEVEVGCLTTDYAMQSVLLQMGLKLISVEGLVIKKIRQYVLKCYGCFKICKDMERKFCPQCGNQTLLRFSVSTDDAGNLVYTQAQRLNTRGTIFPIPLPKGGRNSGDLILSEDQYLNKTKWHKDPKTADVFSSDYAFATGKAGPKNNVVIGYGNKNPNVARRRIGKKNKPISSM